MSLANLKDGLTAYLRGEEASGTRFDFWGDADGTDVSSVGNVAGKIGNAIRFVRSSSDRINIPSNVLNFDGSKSFTIVAHVKMTAGPVGDMAIVAKWDDGTDRSFILFRQNSPDSFQFSVSVDGSAQAAFARPSLAPVTGTFYLLIAEYDAVTNRVTLDIDDGAFTNTSAGTAASLNVSAFDAALGRSDNSGNTHADADVDELLFFTRLLTGAEKTALHNSGSGVDLSATLASEGTPTAPSALGLSAGSPAHSAIDVQFTDNSNNEAYFSIERALSGGGPFSEIIQLQAEPGTGTAVVFTDTGLDPDTEYFYRVRAFNGPGGFSSFTSVESLTTGSVPEDIKTVKPLGGGDYTTLNSWEAGEDRNITASGADVIAVAECSGGADLLSVRITVAGWTVDRFHYIEVRNAPGEHHAGVFSSTFPFSTNDVGFQQIMWTIQQDFFRMRGLQFVVQSSSHRFALIQSSNSNGHFRFEENILSLDRTFAGHSTFPFIIDLLPSPSTAGCGGAGPDGPNVFQNNLFYCRSREGSVEGGPWVFVQQGDLTVSNFFNNTSILDNGGAVYTIGAGHILHPHLGTISEENNYYRVVDIAVVYNTTGTINKGVTTATSNTEAVTPALRSIAYDNTNFQNVVVGISGLDLDTNLFGSALARAGTDLSASGVTRDIKGAVRA